jgi:hypothetical protein
MAIAEADERVASEHITRRVDPTQSATNSKITRPATLVA